MTYSNSRKLDIPPDLKKRLDVLKSQEFTIETQKELASIWSEFMRRLKESGIDDVEWDHPDFAKQRRQAEERVRKEIIRDRELRPS